MSKVFKALLACPAILGASLLVSTSAIAGEVKTTTKVADFSDSSSQPGYSSTKDAASKKNSLAQVTSVSELSDVKPTDWAFQAVQSLVERYGCIEGYPDKTFRGNRAATRYELAAALNACLNQISSQLGGLTAEDLANIKRLQDEFAAELATLRGRVDGLEARTAELEANQFSTTTKLTGEVIFQPAGITGNNAAAIENDDGEVIAGQGDEIDSNIFLGSRARLNFDTSFTGKDRLRVRLQAANNQNLSDVSGTNMARLNVDTSNGGVFSIDDFYYRFPLGDKGNIYIAAAETEFYDAVETFNSSLESEGQGALSRFTRFNPIYRQTENSTGAILNYDFADAFGVSVGYLVPTGTAGTALGDSAGLFSGQYSALAQIGIKPSDAFNLGLTYVRSFYPDGSINLTGSTGSALAQNPFGGDAGGDADHFGAEANLQLSDRFVIGAWGGYTLARSDDADANLLNYSVNVAFPDLFKEGNQLAFAFGQPPKIVGGDFEEDGTSYHAEGLYRFQVSDNISITPGAYVIFNPENDDDNSPVYVGTIRTTFTF